jgi:hypothetical protein
MVTISKEKIITVGKKDVSLKGGFLVIVFGNKNYKLPFREISKKLAAASKSQRENFKVSPSGYGIHWPELAEDLAFAPMLRQARAI